MAESGSATNNVRMLSKNSIDFRTVIGVLSRILGTMVSVPVSMSIPSSPDNRKPPSNLSLTPSNKVALCIPRSYSSFLGSLKQMSDQNRVPSYYTQVEKEIASGKKG